MFSFLLITISHVFTLSKLFDSGNENSWKGVVSERTNCLIRIAVMWRDWNITRLKPNYLISG